MGTETIIDLPEIDNDLVMGCGYTNDENKDTYWVTVFVSPTLKEELVRINKEVDSLAMVKKLITVPALNKLLTRVDGTVVYVSTNPTKHLNDGMDYVGLESFMFNDTWKIKVDFEKYKKMKFLNAGENDE